MRKSLFIVLSISLRAFAAPELVVGDFENGYGGWTAGGTAFGSAPAAGTLANQQPVSGFAGKGLVNSYLGGDAATGTLESPAFTVQRSYLNFLIGGGSHDDTRAELLIDGKVVAKATGIESERLFWTTWDLRPFAGKSARVRLIDEAMGGWGHLLADRFAQADSSYARSEARRPQFHFTAAKGWLNDPNGLVYYAGEYHLFYQHNPYGIPWGNMSWGHAVSPDLIHWQQLPVALAPDKGGECPAYSGSAVVDWDNTAGFQTGADKALVLFYTSFGCGQGLAYSNDKGRTWTKWQGNPAIPQEGDARDPKVFWHAPSRKWVMAVWTPAKGGGIAFYGSADLKKWEYLSIANGYFECPNIWQSNLDEDQKKPKWILHGADGQYRVGSFDGTKFTAEAGPYPSDYGPSWYASQIYSDIPASDGRTINISWMRSDDKMYPELPCNQMMSIPVSLALRTTAAGPRLCRLPVKELDVLRVHSDTVKDQDLAPGRNPLAGKSGALLDVRLEFEPGTASEVGLKLGGATVAWKAGDKTLNAYGKAAPLAPAGGRVAIRVLLDRNSLEVFGNQGEAAFTGNLLPDGSAPEAFATGGTAHLVSLEFHRLRGTWDPEDLDAAWERSRNPVGVEPAPRAGRGSRDGVKRGASSVDPLGRIRNSTDAVPRFFRRKV